MSAKLNKIELSEKFMAMWREEQTLWDVMFTLYLTKMKKTKVCKNVRQISDFFRLIFSNNVLFQMRNCFSADTGDS